MAGLATLTHQHQQESTMSEPYRFSPSADLIRQMQELSNRTPKKNRAPKKKAPTARRSPPKPEDGPAPAQAPREAPQGIHGLDPGRLDEPQYRGLPIIHPLWEVAILPKSHRPVVECVVCKSKTQKLVECTEPEGVVCFRSNHPLVGGFIWSVCSKRCAKEWRGNRDSTTIFLTDDNTLPRHAVLIAELAETIQGTSNG